MARMSAEELLERYAEGEREFDEVNLILASLSNVDLSNVKLVSANLTYANLSSANLVGANLSGANLSVANLSGANLSGANLISANLRAADLRGADLPRANLDFTTLVDAILVGADLGGAKLFDADLSRANFRSANFRGSQLNKTALNDTRIDGLCGSDLFILGPCGVDWRTVAKSLHAPGLHDFLVRCGIPDVVATYLIDSVRSIDKADLFTMLQSTFISYGGPDETFAKRLHEALERNGVKTWFFPRDALPGEKLHREMWRGVNDYDRVILICSKSSLTRPGVLNELERVVEREASEGGSSVLIPIRLDDFVFSEWVSDDRADLKRQIETRVVADFRGTMDDEATFNDALGKLLLALKKRPTDTGS